MLQQPILTFSGATRQTLGARLTSPALNGVHDELNRVGSGLALATLYGLALGARSGGIALAEHAALAAAGLAVVGVLGLPSLFVLLALMNAPVTPRAMLSAGARSVASTGFVLAGLAPSAALLTVTIESQAAAAFVARAGLVLAGGIGLYQFVSSLRTLLAAAPLRTRLKCTAFLYAFCVFAFALAARVWSVLPILKGAV
jgi:hypothetical protein